MKTVVKGPAPLVKVIESASEVVIVGQFRLVASFSVMTAHKQNKKDGGEAITHREVGFRNYQRSI